MIAGVLLVIIVCLNATLRSAKPEPPTKAMWDGVERRRGNLPGKSLDYVYRGPERRKSEEMP
jgi:hypothetical protein